MAVARNIVLRTLTARDHTRAELSRKLASRRVPGEVADAVLDRFGELGLIDDWAFAQRWIQSRQQRRGLSRRALERELSGKGLSRDVVSEATASIEREDELVIACDVARRRLRNVAGLPEEVRARRLAGVLARRGFDPAVIAQAVRTVTDVAVEEADPQV